MYLSFQKEKGGGYVIKSKRRLYTIFLLFIALVSSVIFVLGVTLPNTQNSNLDLNKSIKLAKLYNEDSLDFDRQYRLHYLQKNKNFSDVVFNNITGNTKYTLKAGAVNERIKSVKLNNQNYVIDLLYCEINGKYCAFRINGVPVPQIRSFEQFGNSKVTSFDIDGNYILKVNSIKFNHCEGTGFCHFGYQSYDVVDVMIERKK